MTFEVLGENLFEFIRRNDFKGVSLQLVKWFAVQMLVSLHYMSEFKMVHCDLKPENVLLRKTGKAGVKIIDFGSGCFES